MIEDEEATHNRIAKKMDDLDNLRPKVLIGFCIFWAFLFIGLVFAVVNLF